MTRRAICTAQKPASACKTGTEKIAEWRMALAVYELAELLNSVFP